MHENAPDCTSFSRGARTNTVAVQLRVQKHHMCGEAGFVVLMLLKPSNSPLTQLLKSNIRREQIELAPHSGPLHNACTTLCTVYI